MCTVMDCYQFISIHSSTLKPCMTETSSCKKWHELGQLSNVANFCDLIGAAAPPRQRAPDVGVVWDWLKIIQNDAQNGWFVMISWFHYVSFNNLRDGFIVCTNSANPSKLEHGSPVIAAEIDTISVETRLVNLVCLPCSYDCLCSGAPKLSPARHV